MKAVLGGTLAGVAPVLILTVTLGFGSLPEGVNGDGSVVTSLWLAFFPLALTLPTVITCSVIFGLPFTMFLAKFERESGFAYIAAGGFIGDFLILYTLNSIQADGGYWLCFLGVFSGGVTGGIWWRSREKIIALRHAAMPWSVL